MTTTTPPPAGALVPAFLEARRSIRAFAPRPVPTERLEALVAAAATAPAPHHSRPWRFVLVQSGDAKESLAAGMGTRWRDDLAGDGVDGVRIDELVESSRHKITGAPALVLACLTDDGLDTYPDDTRRRAEWGMALLSLGAAVENLMLAATDAGLASCWVAAPIFCPDEAAASLRLPDGWIPQALVLVGEPDPDYEPRTRPAVDLEALRLLR